ncbi:MAG: PriCT-2 domain-containing protein [Candidatus Methylumidiphilus sp.]
MNATPQRKKPDHGGNRGQGFNKFQNGQANYTSTAPSLEEIESALQSISADDRETWVKAGMAVKSELGDPGFDIWNDWSKAAGNYREADARSVWKSLKLGSVTIKTLFGMANATGWRWTGERSELTPNEQAEREKARAAREIAHQEEQAKIEARQAKAATLFITFWQTAKICESHPYLSRKRVNSHGLRVGDFIKWVKDGNVWRKIVIHSVLMIPMSDENGKVWNMQGIFPQAHPEIEGIKHYLSSGRKSGLFFIIGNPTQTILIAEGYATGATCHEFTGHQTFVAFDCGNLEHVARAVRRMYPDAKIILCADNDKHLPNNPGITHARKAALAVGGFVSIPPISGDWNDYANMGGGI